MHRTEHKRLWKEEKNCGSSTCYTSILEELKKQNKTKTKQDKKKKRNLVFGIFLCKLNNLEA